MRAVFFTDVPVVNRTVGINPSVLNFKIGRNSAKLSGARFSTPRRSHCSLMCLITASDTESFQFIVTETIAIDAALGH